MKDPGARIPGKTYRFVVGAGVDDQYVVDIPGESFKASGKVVFLISYDEESGNSGTRQWR